MTDKRVDELVSAWFEGEHTMFDACTDEPELAWAAILRILEKRLTEDDEALLAAGPLETLLSLHGAAFIDRLEMEARRSPRFKHLLGGVWRHDMPEELWQRIVKLRIAVW